MIGEKRGGGGARNEGGIEKKSPDFRSQRTWHLCWPMLQHQVAKCFPTETLASSKCWVWVWVFSGRFQIPRLQPDLLSSNFLSSWICYVQYISRQFITSQPNTTKPRLDSLPVAVLRCRAFPHILQQDGKNIRNPLEERMSSTSAILDLGSMGNFSSSLWWWVIISWGEGECNLLFALCRDKLMDCKKQIKTKQSKTLKPSKHCQNKQDTLCTEQICSFKLYSLVFKNLTLRRIIITRNARRA